MDMGLPGSFDQLGFSIGHILIVMKGRDGYASRRLGVENAVRPGLGDGLYYGFGVGAKGNNGTPTPCAREFGTQGASLQSRLDQGTILRS